MKTWKRTAKGMAARMGLGDWMPPIAIKALRGELRSANRCEGRYPDFAAALAACGRTGYGDCSLLEIVHAKALLIREMYARPGALEINDAEGRLFSALGMIGGAGPFRVLDFGGGFGVHYFLARKVLGSERALRWCVVETPETVARASSIGTPDLLFATDPEAAREKLGGGIDLVFSSGALQYLPDPLDGLTRLLRVGARYAYLTRWGLAPEGGRIITVQVSALSANGVLPGLPEGFREGLARYPLVLESKAAVLDRIGSNARLIYQCREKAGAYPVLGRQIDYYGFCCECSAVPA